MPLRHITPTEMGRSSQSAESQENAASLSSKEQTHWVNANLGAIALTSLALLVPCFWQPHIEAGDMLSHFYNAWLATLISQGHAPGLWLVPLWTNTVFEVFAGWLQHAFGFAAAERIAASAVVLLFFWGALALVWAINRKRTWLVAPFLAMLAYGYVFELGLMNFYVSVGLSLVFFTLVWHGGLRNWIIAVPILLFALMAHASALWVLGLAAYALAARKLPPRLHIWLFLASLLALVVIRQYWLGHFESGWKLKQLISISGADQFWVFGRQYFLIAAATLVLWGILAVQGRIDWGTISTRIAVQVFLLSACAVVILPYTIRLSAAQLPFGLIYERMSLVTAVMACVVLAGAHPKRWHVVCIAVVAGLYFGFLYLDVRAINRIEAKVESLVFQLPPRQRVLALLPPLDPHDADAHFIAKVENRFANFIAKVPLGRRLLQSSPESRISLIRIIDRVCINRCFSFGNYEAATLQFRIRAAPGNQIVEWDLKQDKALLNGRYVVRLEDVPIYQVYRCGPASTDLCMRSLAVGEVNGALSER